MNGWTLGNISGIKVKVHWTFALLPLYIYLSSLVAGSGLAGATLSVIFVLAIFACVLLHELGHAFAARQFGIPTRDITLLPIGGVAALESIPQNPLQEMWIAVAGPLVNVAIAAVLLLVIGSEAAFNGSFLGQLALANIALVIFNMIPAFPMDGGRVLRSSLALFMKWTAATQVAVAVGKVVAFALGFAGLFSGNFMLVFVALFVFVAANAELYNVQHADLQQRVPNEGHWNEAFADAVPANTPAGKVAMWLASRHATYCRVVESGRTIGTVTKEQLLTALANGRGQTPIGRLIVSPAR